MGKYSSRLTMINDLDSSCIFTEATLLIYDVDPDVVTKKLGITPTGRQKVGGLSNLPNGSKKIGTVNSWLFSSGSSTSSKELRTHLDWLLEKIEPVSEQILEIQHLPDAKMSIRCTWFSAEGLGGPTLWPEQMSRMAELNLECSFSFADYSDSNSRELDSQPINSISRPEN